MNKQVEVTLANPVFDPERQITTAKFGWWAERLITAMLTCNIGME